MSLDAAGLWKNWSCGCTMDSAQGCPISWWSGAISRPPGIWCVLLVFVSIYRNASCANFPGQAWDCWGAVGSHCTDECNCWFSFWPHFSLWGVRHVSSLCGRRALVDRHALVSILIHWYLLFQWLNLYLLKSVCDVVQGEAQQGRPGWEGVSSRFFNRGRPWRNYLRTNAENCCSSNSRVFICYSELKPVLMLHTFLIVVHVVFFLANILQIKLLTFVQESKMLLCYI